MLLIFRQRRREREREEEKHQCVVANHMCPTWDLASNPGMCPDWELNPWPFLVHSPALNALSHTSQGYSKRFNVWHNRRHLLLLEAKKSYCIYFFVWSVMTWCLVEAYKKNLALLRYTVENGIFNSFFQIIVRGFFYTTSKLNNWKLFTYKWFF